MKNHGSNPLKRGSNTEFLTMNNKKPKEHMFKERPGKTESIVDNLKGTSNIMTETPKSTLKNAIEISATSVKERTAERCNENLINPIHTNSLFCTKKLQSKNDFGKEFKEPNALAGPCAKTKWQSSEYEQHQHDRLDPEGNDVDGYNEVDEYDVEEFGEGFEDGEEDNENQEDDEDGEDDVEEEEEEQEIELPVSVQERTRKKELEVFVGGLDKNTTEEELRKVFNRAGQVIEVRLLRVPMTNKNKGYGFIRYGTKEEAKRAVNELKDVVIRGKRCGVALSEDNDTLFLGNICNTWTKEAVKERLKFYGVEGLEELTLVRDTQNEGLSRGFAFLAFSTHLDAMKAYKRLQKPDAIFGGERTAKVAFAEPLREPDEEVMAQVKSVFVDGIPPHWDEDQVKEHLNGYGEIERVVLARNMPTAKRRDFGFVNFSSHDEAMACIEGLNNTMIIDGECKMKVKVRLANPLPKSQAVKGGIRGGFPLGKSGIGIRSRGWDARAQSYPFKKANLSRGKRFQSVWQGKGYRPQGGRISSKDDDDVRDLFRMFREQLIHDGRRPVVAHSHSQNIGLTGKMRGSFGSYEKRSFPYSTKRGRTSSKKKIDRKPEVYRPRQDILARGKAISLESRTHSFSSVEDSFHRNINRNLDLNQPRKKSYPFDYASYGTKRPYSLLDNDFQFIEPAKRGPVRPHYGHSSSLMSDTHYMSSQNIASDSFGSRGAYSSRYGGSIDSYGSKASSGRFSPIYGGSHTTGEASHY